MKTTKIIHWISTGLLSALLLFSASMYLFQNAAINIAFESLGFPTWIIYPLATLKILGVLMLITKAKAWLTEWTYAGIIFNTLLAAGAHLAVSDGEQGGAIMGLVLAIISFATWKSMTKVKS